MIFIAPNGNANKTQRRDANAPAFSGLFIKTHVGGSPYSFIKKGDIKTITISMNDIFSPMRKMSIVSNPNRITDVCNAIIIIY